MGEWVGGAGLGWAPSPGVPKPWPDLCRADAPPCTPAGQAHPAVLVSQPSGVPHVHTGTPPGVAHSHCIIGHQTQLSLSPRVRPATAVVCRIIVERHRSEPRSQEVISSTYQ